MKIDIKNEDGHRKALHLLSQIDPTREYIFELRLKSDIERGKANARHRGI